MDKYERSNKKMSCLLYTSYQFLRDHGAAAIFGPGTVIPAAAKEMLVILNKRLAAAHV